MKKSTKIIHKNAVFLRMARKKVLQTFGERRLDFMQIAFLPKKQRFGGGEWLKWGSGMGILEKLRESNKKGLTKSPSHGKISHTIMNTQITP